MRTFAQKPKPSHQSTPATSSAPTRARFGPRREASPVLHASRAEQQSPATAARFGHDFSQVPIQSKHDDVLDQSSGSGAPAPSASPAPTLAPVVSVDAIDIVDSATGAITGYPAITSGDLNVPGPYNNPGTGGVNNVHQIHFHFDQGSSSAATPTRELQRSAWRAGVENKNPADKVGPPAQAGGFNGVITGPDGPPAHEIQRPTTDKLVVADAPGTGAVSTAQFPYIYKSHFTIKVAAGGKDIARIAYDVAIEKTSAANVPNKQNSITAVTKEDMVRGRSMK